MPLNIENTIHSQIQTCGSRAKLVLLDGLPIGVARHDDDSDNENVCGEH